MITGSLGRARFAGALSLSSIRVAGSIGSITAGSMAGSRIFAGVSGALNDLPQTTADFAHPAASIALVAVRGAFTNSLVAAPTIGRVTLASVSPDNNGTAFGVAADTLQSVLAAAGVPPVRALLLDDPTESIRRTDFEFRLLEYGLRPLKNLVARVFNPWLRAFSGGP